MEHMNEQRTPNLPYKTLGTHLKYLREQQKESLAEVSGAVEINTEELERIEQGMVRPSEDILLLLISHFNMQDQEAVQLWELAGYDGEAPGKFSFVDDLPSANGKPVVMLIGLDMRTQYSDGLDVIVNKAGLTLSFTQAAANNQRMPVGRIGMSVEQAEQVLKILQQAILKAKYGNGPQALPPKV
jgi:transcriptional regulator with XRE-family HTH domain